MEQQCNCTVCRELMETMIKKIEKWEQSKDNNSPKQIKEFDIATFENAAHILCCSINTVRKAINDKKLIKDIHYRHNGRRKYLFCKTELKKIKGTL